MIDQSSDSRKATEIFFHNTIILVTFVCLLVRLLVHLFFLDIAACFSAIKSNAKSDICPTAERNAFKARAYL